jgi:multidrug efflux pump subunit AcrB
MWPRSPMAWRTATTAASSTTRAAVLLVINRQSGANIIETVEQIKAELPALQAVLPASVKLDVAMDRSPVIKATLQEAEHDPADRRGAGDPGGVPVSATSAPR